MLCQECKQKPASVHLTKIINNHKTELHLCEECAGQREDFMNITPFSVNDLIAGFMDMSKAKRAYERPAPPKCAVCGMDYNQFKKIGRLGCQECYKYFGNELEPVLRKIQGSTVHNGKVPKRCGSHLARKKQIAELKAELKRAVEVEAFEKAAELRDLIKELEHSQGTGQSQGGNGL
jgi:protein arginine kinase activator